MAKVYAAKCTSYSDGLEALIDNIFREFDLYDRIKTGMTVVLKPNMIMRTKPEVAAVTHPLFVAAVGKCVKKAGADVLIAESPGGPYTPAVMKSHFKGCGYTDMAESCGFSLYTDCVSREVSMPDAAVCRNLSIVEPFLENDFLIDLAKLKTHSMVGFSGAAKNMFGAVPGLQKPELHCRFPDREIFSKMLVDICDFLKPDFSFIDGIWAMEGDGPTGGTRRIMNAVIASDNPYAADMCACDIVGIDPKSIYMLADAASRGLCPERLEDIEVIGDGCGALRAPDFKKARASSTDFVQMVPKFLRPLAKKIVTPYPKIDLKKCVGCGKCAESCPQHTIDIRDKKAYIDYKKCIRCFCCHEMCPQHIIGVRRFGAFKL